MEEKLKHVPWTKKKEMLEEMAMSFTKAKALKDADPKQLIKNEYRMGNLSAFAANDLIRMYEVMEETESVSKLKIRNLQRI